LALAILCLLLGAVYLLLVSPVLDLYSQREATLADRRMLAPRLSAAAAVLPELRARLAELQASATTRNIALDGASAQVRSNWTVVQNSPEGPKVGSAGAYQDELVKEHGHWLFRYRKIDRFIAP